MDRPTVDDHVVERRELVFRPGEECHDRCGRVLDRIELHLQRADPRHELGRSERRRRVQPRAERLCSQAEIEVERHRSVLHEDGSVALRAVGDLRNVAPRGAGRRGWSTPDGRADARRVEAAALAS